MNEQNIHNENQEGKPVDLTEEVVVKATEKSPYLQKGKTYKISALLAKSFVERGYCTIVKDKEDKG